MVSGSPLAIVGGRVLPGGPASFAAADARLANVIIADGRIVARDGEAAPAGAQVIDATGLTVLPGLIELHTHVPSPLAMALYVQQGITSIRFAGSTLGAVPRLRQTIASGQFPGPRVFSCGPLLDEPPAAWAMSSTEVTDAATARAAATSTMDAEAEALIVAQRIRPTTLAAIAAAAHARDVPVTGQVWTTSVREALQAGMDGVENTARLPEDPRLAPEWVE